jgi:inner membrane transporter RhtA
MSVSVPAARPALSVVAAVSSVQVGAAVAKHLFPVIGTVGTVAVRVTTAAVVLALVTRAPVRTMSRRHLAMAVGFGLLMVGLNLTFYASIARIPLGVAVTVEFAGPLAVAVLGSRRAVDVLWVLLAGGGVVLLTGGGRALLDGSLDPLGVGLALLAGAGWAGYILASQRVGAVLPGIQGLAIAFVAAAVVMLPVGIATAGAALLEPRVLIAATAVGILSSAVPAGLEMAALRSLSTSTFGVLMSLEPAGAALAGLLVLGERLSMLQWLAIALTCTASAGAAATGRPRGVEGLAEPVAAAAVAAG